MADGKSTFWKLLTTDVGRAGGGRKPGKYKGPRLWSEFRRGALLQVTNILFALVKTNFPLVDGLHMSSLEARSRRVRPVLESLAQSLSVGFTLADAMAAQTRFFPKWYVDLVRAAEETGGLPNTLDRISNRLRQDSQQFFLIAFAVIIVVSEALMIFGIVNFLIMFVFPTFSEIFEDFENVSDSAFQQIVMGTDFLYMSPLPWQLMPVVCGAIVFFVVLYRKVDAFRALMTRIALSLPIVRRIARDTRLSHASQVLAQLLRARIPMDAALESAATADIGPYHRRAFVRVANRVREGSTLADGMENEPAFSKAYTAQIRLAELAEDLPGVLESLSERYRDIARQRKEIAIQLVLPVFVLTLGAITLAIELAVFSGIVSLSESLSVPM